MDINKFASLGNYSRSLETKEICILVANDDHICCNIVASMLKYCTYEAFKYDTERDTFNAMWGRKEGIEVVLTNIFRTEPITTRMTIIDHIEKDFKLTTFLMSPDGIDKIDSKGLAGGATVYYLKNITRNVIKKLYINSLMEMKAEIEGMELVDSLQKSLISEYLVGTNNVGTSISDEESWGTNTQKRKEQDGHTRDDSSAEKKSRVVWNDGMHKKFMDAIEQIGYEKAVPRKIIEVMNVPGLTREKISSHLQKYRTVRKQVEKDLSNLLNVKSLTNNVKAASSRFSCALENSEQPCWRSNPFGSRNGMPTPNSSGHSSIFSHEASTSSSSRSRPAPGSSSRSRPAPRPVFNHHFDYASVMDFGRKQNADQQVREKQNFRFYDDNLTKNILSGFENRWSTSSNNATSCSTSYTSPYNYMGPRLTSDWKSMEFGKGFSPGGNFVPFPQLKISNIENSLLIPQQEQYIGNQDSSRLGNCNSLQESEQDFVGNGNGDSDWTLDFEAIDRLLEQEKSLPLLSGEMAWDEAAAAAVQQQPSENEASVPPMVALPSESSSLRIYGGNRITQNEAAAPPLVGFQPNFFGVDDDDDGGLEALLQETENTGPRLF